MDFDFGTVHEHWWGNYDIGKGMADQVVDALLEDGTFRVIERKKLDTVLAEQDFARSDRADPSAAKLAKVGKVLGVKYIISGSITKFGGEEKNYGGGGLLKGKLGGLGLKKAKTEVSLTARIIDATTGEILASRQGRGRLQQGRRPQGRRARRRRRGGLLHELERLQGERDRRGPGGRDRGPGDASSWPRRTGSSSSGSEPTAGSREAAEPIRRPLFLPGE